MSHLTQRSSVPLTSIPQIHIERHPEASHHLQMQLARPTVNTAPNFARTSFGLDAFTLLPQTFAVPHLILHPNYRVRCSFGVPGRVVLRVPVLHRRSQCFLYHSLGYRCNGIETLDCCARESPGRPREVKINNPQVRQLGLISCTFRQTNIVWLFYGYISSQLTFIRFRRDGVRLPDPPALEASPGARDSALTHNPPHRSLVKYRRSRKDCIKRSQDLPGYTSFLCAVLCRCLALCTLHQMERGNRLGSVVHTFIS